MLAVGGCVAVDCGAVGEEVLFCEGDFFFHPVHVAFEEPGGGTLRAEIGVLGVELDDLVEG